FIGSLVVERDVSFDLRNSGIRILIRPYRIAGLLSSSGNAVVTAIAFVRAVGGVICPFQLRKIDIFTRNVLNRWIVRCAKGQGVPGIGYYTTRNGDDNASRIIVNRDRMI